MIIANFEDENYKRVTGLWQWDYGQVLRIQGLNLPNAVEIHFSLQESGGEAKKRVGFTKDGVTDVVIPDSLLENEEAIDDYNAYAFVYLTDDASGQTEYKICMPVKARPKPEAFDKPEDGEIFREAIKAVNDAADRAEESERQAGEYAEQTKADAQKTTADRQEVERLVDSVSGIGEQVEAVKEYKDQAQTAATNALLSEQKSEQAKEAAAQARAGAETAEGKTEQHALEVAGDKSEVERLATQVRQDKTSVEQTAQGFGNTVQQAEQSINTAKTQAVETVNATKTDAVKAVQTAAQEIIADREQIQTNKADIADLRQSKSGAIVESASGETIVVRDSSSHFFEDFRVLGKSEQGGNPSPDNKQNITNIGKNGSVGIKVRGKNLIQYPYIQSDKYDPMYNAKAGSVININGVTVTVLEDRALKIVGTVTTDTYINVMRDKVLVNKNDVKYSKDLSHDINNGLIFYLVKKDETINKIVYPQAEIGETVTEYEPWKGEQILTIPLEQPLARWDRIEKRNNVWGIARKAAEKILDGTEEWGTYKDFTTDGLKCYVVYNVLSEFGFQNSICTHFKNVDKAWINGIGKNGYYSDHDTVVFKYFITDKPTLEEFKAWLLQQKEAGTPVKLVYKTQTEIWEPLPQETQQALNALHTYYPSTTITNSEDAKMEMSYVADTKKWTENKLTEIVTAHTQGIANLLSLMPLSVQAGMVETDVNNILENVEEMKHE